MATQQPTLSFPRQIFAKLSPHPYLLAHLSPPSSTPQSTTPPLAKRPNGRTPTTTRPLNINTGSLSHCAGSAVTRIGDTTVVCGVRAEILLATNAPAFRHDNARLRPGKEYNEAKELDLLVPNIELATGCSPLFMPGQPPSTLAQTLSTRIYSLIHASNIIDGEELRIWYQPPGFEDEEMGDGEVERAEPEGEIKAFWTLYIDILFISLDGNPFDAAWLAVLAALKDVRLPQAYWDPDLQSILCSDVTSQSKRLTLNGLPISTTALVFRAKEGMEGKGGDKRSWILLDPDAFEEGLCSETVSVVVDCSRGTRVLGIEKHGGVVVGKEEMAEIVRLAEARWRELGGVLTKG
ncbi:ribosomal protein S5 domain 2-type protein [Bisporella sp. PMI_857]|nr:ribosomal protein S5 domain 2-type protein [Bisporella sp. PMI_857]